MVRLSPSSDPDVSPPSEQTEEGKGSPKSCPGPTQLQLALSTSTTAYHSYDTYIEDGLICLKHKIRNIEKKKLKLEDYKRRLKNGEELNKDQMEAVEKFEEVVHNLAFAKELQKTLGGLTQDLLRSQKKLARREQLVRVEMERKRLSWVLQLHHVLQTLQLEHVQRDFRSGLNHAPFLPPSQLQLLLNIAPSLGCKRDESTSLEDQMEQAAGVYWELMEGRDLPVAGSTYKHLKELLSRLMDCGYFEHIPLPRSGGLDGAVDQLTRKAEGSFTVLPKSLSASEVAAREGQSEQTRASKDLRKADLPALLEEEPPDCWDMEFTDKPSSPPPAQKPFRGAATFVPKAQVTTPRPTAEPKQRRERSKGAQEAKSVARAEGAVEFSCPSPLPQDPRQREVQLQHLMQQIQGSFCFMQDSVLDREGSPKNARSGEFSSSPRPVTPTARDAGTVSPVSALSKLLHSTPLQSSSRMPPAEGKVDLPNGDASLHSSLLDLTADEAPPSPVIIGTFKPPQVRAQSPCSGVVPPISRPPPPYTPPPSSHALSMASTPYQTMQSVFKVSAPLAPTRGSDLKLDESAFSDSSLTVVTASTQTSPDFLSLEVDTLPPVSPCRSEGVVSNGCQVYLSPGQPRPSQPYYPRGSSRGGLEGFRTGVRSPGGSFIPHSARDVAPVLYGVQDSAYQPSYKRGGLAGGQRSHLRAAAAWSDSSQVSSPERDCSGYTAVDSGHGDSRCLTPIDGPALLPVHVYPLPPPLRVAFCAARSVNFTPGTLDQTIAFDLLHCNLGEAFDAHLGHFTCPAAGTYVFLFHILKLAISVPLYVNLMRNEEVMVSAYANDGAPDHETASNHALLQLYQGDRVWLRLHRGAIYGSSWKYSTFSGYLLYQD